MLSVVGVHGIGNYGLYREHGGEAAAAEVLAREWRDWLGAPPGLVMSAGYYSHLLHRGTSQGATDPGTLELEEQMTLLAWVDQLQPRAVVPQGPLTSRARQATDWLTKHFGAAAAAACLLFCREVHTYLSDPASPRRVKARGAVAAAVARAGPDVVIAHSLGSVVTYEALWESRAEVPLLVTIGSPLGMHGVVFERLMPPPSDGLGRRPPGVQRWVNIADVGDIVAVPRGGLSPHFQGVEADMEVVIDAIDFHRAQSYLSHPDVRRLILGVAH